MYFLPDKSSISKDYTGGKVECIICTSENRVLSVKDAEDASFVKRELGVNPKRSSHCIPGVFFSEPLCTA